MKKPKLIKKDYQCKNCKKVWTFNTYIEDYLYDDKNFPKTCLFCQMPSIPLTKKLNEKT